MSGTVVYVSNADSAEISVLALDEARGTLALRQSMPCGGTVMPLALRPDRRVLYAAIRNEPWRVLAFAIDAREGRLTALGEAPLAQSMAHIAVDTSGRWLFSASYGGGLITLNPLAADGAPQPPCWQQATPPKAHAMRASVDNRFAYATSLGGDQLLQFAFDAERGALTPLAPPAFAGRRGTGARHLAFHPNGRIAWLLNELDATLDVLAVDTAGGQLSALQTVSFLPPGFAGEPWGAELRLTPDARFVYASERRSSTLAGFAVDAQGRLALIGHWPTQAQPRGFAVTPSGRFLIAAGQLSNAVGLHAIDAASGALTLRHELAVGRNPNWVEAIALA
ncbi:MAG TPA: lactonase family protein [Piscinibacter sp.]|nr:lactonase family protein [Piscinibacter sp.]